MHPAPGTCDLGFCSDPAPRPQARLAFVPPKGWPRHRWHCDAVGQHKIPACPRAAGRQMPACGRHELLSSSSWEGHCPVTWEKLRLPASTTPHTLCPNRSEMPHQVYRPPERQIESPQGVQGTHSALSGSLTHHGSPSLLGGWYQDPHSKVRKIKAQNGAA